MDIFEIEALVPATRFTLGSQDHMFRIGGKIRRIKCMIFTNEMTMK